MLLRHAADVRRLPALVSMNGGAATNMGGPAIDKGGPSNRTLNIAYEFTLMTNIDTEPFGFGQVAILHKARNSSYITKHMM